MITPRRFSWVRTGDRYPDLVGTPDDFIAMDGETEVGVVKLVVSATEASWMWSMLLVHSGRAFGQPTNGLCTTRGEAALELGESYAAFRKFYGLDEEGRQS
jgi:hypothetical protein